MDREIPLIGVSDSVLKIKELIRHVANTGLNILITGETGVGKELVAQRLYTLSPRASSNFVKVNCAALPETLLESELYGYEKGAFTGAYKKRQGKFLAADKGVLFLDEIGDMPLALQSKILHVLQTGEFSPLGSEQEFKTDVWVIAATNHQLEKKIAGKEFREDLFYRLNIIKIEVPPLRDRPEDIPPLIEYYFKIYAAQYPDNKPEKPDKAVLQKMAAHSWPGNVRELQNCIKKQMVMNDWHNVLADFEEGFGQESAAAGPVETAGEKTAGRTGSVTVPGKRAENKLTSFDLISQLVDIPTSTEASLEDLSLKKIKKRATDKVEREVISYVLNRVGWNRAKAAKILKVSYKTILYKINELNITHRY